MAVLQERFIARAEAIRESESISISELARRMDVDRRLVAKYLDGDSSPGLEMAERFAKALGLEEASELIGVEETAAIR